MSRGTVVLALVILLLAQERAARSQAPQSQPTPQERAQQLQAQIASLESGGAANDPALATALNELGILHFTQGEFAAAEPLMRRALSIRERALGSEHPHTAQALNNLALILQERGDYPAAQPLLERALAMQQKTHGAEHPEVATALNNLAALHRLTGNFAEAEPLYRRALAISEKVNGPEHATVAVILNNLGLLFQQQGQLDKARPLMERSLALREKLSGVDHLDVARAANNLAIVLQELGELAGAETLYNRALAIYEKALGRQHQLYGQTLNNLAVVHLVKGEHAIAGPLYEQALAIRTAALGAAHPDMAVALTSQAIYFDVVGRIDDAVARQTEAAAVAERSLDLILGSGSEAQKQRYMETFSENTDITVSMHRVSAPANAAAGQLALTTLLRRKGRVLDAVGLALGSLRDRMSVEDQSALDALATARTQLARLVLRGPGRQDPALFTHDVTVAEESVRQAEREISIRSTAYRAQAQPVTVEEVQRSLPPGAALVEIAVYRPFNNRAAQREKRFGPPRYVAYVLQPGQQPDAIELGDVSVVDRDVDAFRRALSDPRSNAVRRSAVALHNRIFAPLRPAIRDAKRLFISPDGALNLVPFAALADASGRYLVESLDISYLTSGRDLLRLRERAAESGRSLIVANPAFGSNQAEPTAASDRAVDFSRARFTALAGTEAEAKALASLMPDAEVRTGAEATEGSLRMAHAPRVLHLATHGFFLGNATAVQGDQTRALVHDAIPPGGMAAAGPLLRSGLAFAGANTRRGGDGHDGILTALEASTLDLWGTRLAVLSACETGVGELRRGDGVYGLRRALVVAGAESQVISLWQVSDEGTRELMTGFYTNLKAGTSRSAALRSVQLQMLRSEKRRHPYYWASFILSGADGPIVLQ